jgi:serine/threonine protein phosphatase PrpC/rRNA maturation endonuclease Nob1
MQCRQCGAELRPTARFCSRCGAPQTPAVASVAPGPRSSQAPSAAEPSALPETAASPQAPSPDDIAPAADEAIRAKRPPRVPRARDEDEPEDAQSLNAEAAESTQRSQSDEGLNAESAEGTQRSQSDTGGTNANRDTSDHSVSAASALKTPGEGSYLDDGLSWPLPPNIIVGGRYRIEAVVSAAASLAASLAGENVYRVKDLQGYERCWSCDTAYTIEPGQVPEQFCRECGADMLGRPYILRERLLPEDTTSSEASPATDTVGAQPAAPGGQDVGAQPATNTVGARLVSPDDEAPTLPDEHIFRQGRRRFTVEPEEVELPPFPHGAHILIASASDIGRERGAGQNEDSVGQLVLQIETESRAQPLALAIVADGLGGHASGREASRAVVRAIVRHVTREVALPLAETEAPPLSKDTLKQILRDAIAAANAALHAANAESQRDMGSTVVAALIYDETAFVANVGDSRAYVLDGGTLRRLTSDHSLVEQLVAGGMIAPEERYTHPNRNQIFRSLGVGASRDNLGIDLFTQRLRPGMRLLLCSDGLWEMAHDDEITRILRETPNPQVACDALVRAANEHGGEDNISALVVEISG